MKKLSYLFILLLFPIVAFAQEATEQDKENKEKIKEIKLSEDYVYADAVTEDNLSEAQQNSMDLLRANVNAIFAERFHMPKEDVEEIWDVIEDKCQNVTIKKGDLFRVFTYIMKDYLFPGKKKKKNSPSRHQLPEQAVCTADQKTGQYIACHSHRKIPYCRDSAARFHHPCCNSDSDQGEQRTRQIPCKHGIQHRITGAERGCRKTPSSRGRSFQKKGGKAQNSIIQQKILCKEKIQKDLIVQKNTPCACCMV